MPTLTQALDELAAHVGPEFPRIYRRLTREHGFRQLGKAIVCQGLEPKLVPTNGDRPTARRNGNRRLPKRGFRKYWWKYEDIPDLAWSLEHDRNRYARNEYLVWPFTWSPRVVRGTVDYTEEVLAKYEPRECCGEPMGIMEMWKGIPTEGQDGPQAVAVYQCAVDPKHQQAAYSRIDAEAAAS